MARFSVEGDEDGNGEAPSNNNRFSRKRLCASDPPAVAPKRASASTSNASASASASLSASAGRQIYEAYSPDPMEGKRYEDFFGDDSERVVEEAEEEEEEVEEEEEAEEEEVGEEEHEEMVQPVEARADSTRNGNDKSTESGDVPVPLSVTLADPDVLDCPICLEPLNSPIYQCENGHIACSPCCIKMGNKCPSCCWPIGYNRCRAIERVLDSVRISCCNRPHGCQEYLPYNKKLQHEKTCHYVPCSCPHPNCTFSGLSRTIYDHFSVRHRELVEPFSFLRTSSVKLGAGRKYVFLQEKSDATLFVLNRCVEARGSLVSIVCIAQASLGMKFGYEVSASDGESSTISLSSIAENIGSWIEGPLEKKYLLIPKDFTHTSGDLVLEISIWKSSRLS